MKPRFLAALKRNDADDVDEILRTSNLDIDTVFDVEDPKRVLASYKQGNFYRFTVQRMSSDYGLPQEGGTTL